MKKRIQNTSAHLRTIAIAVMLSAVGSTATTLDSSTSAVGRYDFAYVTQGNARVKPLQVFDDGDRTYFQFRSDAPIPAIFAGNGHEMLLPYREGPYVVVNARPREFTLALGLARGLVAHAAVISGAQPRAAVSSWSSPEAGGAASLMQPARYDAGNATLSSYATPVRGDVIEWREQGRPVEQPIAFRLGSAELLKPVRDALPTVAGRIGSDSRVTVIGREDASGKEGLAESRARALRDALIAAGVPARNIVMQIGVETGEPVRQGRTTLVASTVRWTPSRAPREITSPGEGSYATAAAPTPLSSNAQELLRQRAAAGDAVARRTLASWRPDAAPQAQQGPFSVSRSDGDIGTSLQRWGKSAGYEVVWEATKAPVTGDALLYAPDFLGAVKQVVASLQQAGYPLKAQVYTDRVVRISSSKE